MTNGTALTPAIKTKPHFLLQSLPYLAVAICVCAYFVFLLKGEVPQDEGDGLQHFATAQEAWNRPELFVDHWGKPFFILFSSGFAQFGFYGYITFNILVFALSCVVAFRVMQKYHVNVFIMSLIPFILLSIPAYSNGVIGGMTEPFFSLLLLLMLWCSVNEKWLWFAILASFTPFARNEGLMIVMGAAVYLLFLKQWKHVPFLVLGFVLYMIVGWILVDQPLWYFENDPHPAASIYGSGPWDTYLRNADEHLGVVCMVLGLPALVGWFLLVRKRFFGKDALLFGFYTAIYLGIIVVHSYLWAKGLKGSLGLSRLATLGLVPFVVLLLIGVNRITLHWRPFFTFLLTVPLFLLTALQIRKIQLPTHANPHQKAIKDASHYIQMHENEVGTIYYFHPLIAFYTGRNTQQDDPKYKRHFAHLEKDAYSCFKPGDLLIRESKFGDIDQGLPLGEMTKYPWIVPVKHFYTTDFYTELNGEIKSVIVYQIMDRKTFDPKKWDEALPTTLVKPTTKTQRTNNNIKDQYYNLDTALVVPQLNGPRQEYIADIALKTENNKTLYLIFDDGKGYYLSVPINAETKEVALSFVRGNLKGMLFVHNPDRIKYTLEFEPKYWKQRPDSGIVRVK